jgi:hypothetical protein
MQLSDYQLNKIKVTNLVDGLKAQNPFILKGSFFILKKQGEDFRKRVDSL